MRIENCFHIFHIIFIIFINVAFISRSYHPRELFLSYVVLSRAYLYILNKRQKIKSLENITWSQGKQNLHSIERYHSGGQQFYWNKRKRLHKKRVQLLQDWFRKPPCHCFWCHVKTLCCFGTLTWLLHFSLVNSRSDNNY